MSIPKLVLWTLKDHYILKGVLATEHFDRVISDNRFGCYLNFMPEKPDNPRPVQTVYITHQLMIKMPWWLGWLEPIMANVHRHIIKRYSQCWIPDNAGEDNLSGDLSHKYRLPKNALFIGPLSRFNYYLPEKNDAETAKTVYPVVAVLSGLEPQRTMFEKDIIKEYEGKEQQVLIVRGKVDDPKCEIKHDNITLVPWMDDKELVPLLLSAELIIARSGYTTLMDLQSIGCLDKARLVPTPGQTEQEYLAKWLQTRRSERKTI